MSYMLLVIEEGEKRRARPMAEGRLAMDRMLRFAADLQDRGVLKVSDSLAADSRGVRVQSRAGKRSLVDGPFTEAKEIVGGFFLLDGVTREEAVAIASECPAAEWATVEVRAVGPCWDGAPES
jgi:hypothetical protein